MRKIISFGEVLWDLFPVGEQFGGASANFACHTAILGADVSLISAVGDDTHGTEAMEILRRYGIDVRWHRRATGNSHDRPRHRRCGRCFHCGVSAGAAVRRIS